MIETVYTEQDLVEFALKCANVLDEKKAKDTIIMDLKEVNSYFDYFVITTANSLIHCRSLAKDSMKILDTSELAKKNRPDFDSGWIVLDYGDIVIHIFTEELRNFYSLEKLWGDAKIISNE